MSAPKPADGVVLHELPDGTHALTRGISGDMLVVNDVGAAVWLLLDGCDSVAAVCERVTESTGGEPGAVRADVEGFLRELRDRGFVR